MFCFVTIITLLFSTFHVVALNESTLRTVSIIKTVFLIISFIYFSQAVVFVYYIEINYTLTDLQANQSSHIELKYI